MTLSLGAVWGRSDDKSERPNGRSVAAVGHADVKAEPTSDLSISQPDQQRIQFASFAVRLKVFRSTSGFPDVLHSPPRGESCCLTNEARTKIIFKNLSRSTALRQTV